MFKNTQLLLFLLFFLVNTSLSSQITIGDNDKFDYTEPKEYIIGGITVSGIKYIDESFIKLKSGLIVGELLDIPGIKITNAIKNLWEEGIFGEIEIKATKIQGNLIFLDIYINERPKLSMYTFKGLRKGEVENLRKEIGIKRDDAVTEHMLNRIRDKITNYYIEKAFLNVEIDIVQKVDTLKPNYVILTIHVNKNNKVKIGEIVIEGNEKLSDNKIKRLLKETKKKNIVRFWKKSRFSEQNFKEDKLALINAYNALGHRDAIIQDDSVYKLPDGNLGISITIDEGPVYFIRNITWVGNTRYSDDTLSQILGFKKGDIYNQQLLESKLFMNMEGVDVSSYYLDFGYLFFNLTPVELMVENDSIDLELRITEGKQAIINKVKISGNTRTNDYVIIREVRTKPGQLFNRSDIIRTQQELAQTRYFNNETLGLDYEPNQAEGTVALEYQVEETSSDQIELSGGWGGGRLIGTLGVSFNNFSIHNIFKKSAWRPLPSGDGQKLSIRAQSYGIGYYNFSASFTEPWLGGKKPKPFSVTAYHSSFSNAKPKDDPDRYAFKINGMSISLGKRLKWPDDYFYMNHSISIQNYVLQNYTLIEAFNNGDANNLSYIFNLSRNSSDDWIYPTKGSDFDFSLQMTPPYSLFSDKNYADLSDQERYKWIEYHKWKFRASYYINLAGNLVLHTRAKVGFLGSYNKEIGATPFERFYLGGDGLSGINQFDGREIIGMRGYGASELNPRNRSGAVGGTIYNKYSVELRYAVSKNPMSSIYVMTYFEAGNVWNNYAKYNPFELRRTAGVGIRVYLPMFGVLGLDYAWGLDEIPGVHKKGAPEFHFSINNSID
ncbi:MAG: outer membrane protein assembly factor BamA [Bacteroidales bacterium]|nr:outer membrane protein assembly factor BamA [Bacteroidales bacterium]